MLSIRDLTGKLLATVIMITVVGGTRTACTATDDVSVTERDGALVFVSCLTADVTTIEVAATGESGRTEILWTAEGIERNIDSATEITYGVPPSDMTNVDQPSTISPESAKVQFYARRVVNGSSESGVFAEFQMGDIPDDGWLNSIRGAQDAPCGS